MFWSAVWTLILTAPIHCRGSIGQQVMLCTQPNLFWRRNKLIYILDGLKQSTSSANFNVYLNSLFITIFLWEKKMPVVEDTLFYVCLNLSLHNQVSLSTSNMCALLFLSLSFGLYFCMYPGRILMQEGWVRGYTANRSLRQRGVVSRDRFGCVIRLVLLDFPLRWFI